MNKNNALMNISKISDNIYLSGIFPMEQDPNIIGNLGIKYILCCVDKEYVSDIHSKVIMNNPAVTILYLPYNDDTAQNLWKTNTGLAKMTSYTSSNATFDKLTQQLNMYQNKPIIEVGYHFMDLAVGQNDKVLVHCMAGVSRSVSLVTYYFMKKMYMPYDTATKMVKTHRPIASPNDSFKQQLKQYEVLREKFTESDARKIILSRDT